MFALGAIVTTAYGPGVVLATGTVVRDGAATPSILVRLATGRTVRITGNALYGVN